MYLVYHQYIGRHDTRIKINFRVTSDLYEYSTHTCDSTICLLGKNSVHSKTHIAIGRSLFPNRHQLSHWRQLLSQMITQYNRSKYIQTINVYHESWSAVHVLLAVMLCDIYKFDPCHAIRLLEKAGRRSLSDDTKSHILHLYETECGYGCVIL